MLNPCDFALHYGHKLIQNDAGGDTGGYVCVASVFPLQLMHIMRGLAAWCADYRLICVLPDIIHSLARCADVVTY